jgi:hypothetical protein
MLRLLVVLLFVLGTNVLVAEPPAATSPKSETDRPPTAALPYDPATVAAAMRGSYYHPDEMSALDCTFSVDWSAFFSALKMDLAADRLKAIQGLKIRSHATRDKKPDLTFEWADGSFDNKEQFQDGLNQMLGGFYQVYWSMVASSPISKGDELAKIEPLPNGGVKVYFSSQNTNLVITADRDYTPLHYALESPAMNGTVDLHYEPSPKPVPGDLRRISSMDLTEQIGSSTMNIKLSFDYQTVDGFYVPRHVSYNLGGAYSLSMDLSGCSAPKGALAHQAK